MTTVQAASRRVLISSQAGIATITLQDPRRRNALSSKLIEDVLAGLDRFECDRSRVVVLRAAPGTSVWSAGHDVRELRKPGGTRFRWSDPLRVLIRRIEEFRAPVTGLIEGSVRGGACEVALACDLLIATPDATFALTPARLGVPYNAAGLLTFMNRIPLAILKEMAFGGEPIDAWRAAEVGIVNHVVPAQEVEGYVPTLARRISRNAPLAVSVMKEQLRLLKSAHSLTPEMFERLQGLRRTVYDSRDYQEGIRAFLEKRVPEFTGE